MEKLAYILKKDPGQPGDTFANALLGSVGPALAKEGRVRGLTIEVPDLADDPHVTPAHLTGRGPEIGGAMFAWLDSVEGVVQSNQSAVLHALEAARRGR